MHESEKFYHYKELPKFATLFAKLLGWVDLVFDKVYRSKYNPLYRSGTLAVLFLFIALVTGLYLIFFYRIGSPYASIVEIQNQVFLGRWIRALHRYVSDAAVLAVIVHVIRLLVQGKTWGPRVLAWITGVFLTIFMFFSAWTGYVMVWDEHGQALAVEGARMLDLMPIFPDSVMRNFTGDKPILPAFFFMNLFAHVAVPLGMILVLWLHTSKLARAQWLPEKKITWWLVGLFTFVSIIIPAPLPKSADMLSIPGRFETDLFYNFWLPGMQKVSPTTMLLFFVIGTVILLSFPWWWRPGGWKLRHELASSVNKDKCEGCSQCYADCPFDAIQMLERNEEGKPPLYSQVNPDLCVACGICAASCSTLAIGPKDRTAFDAIQNLKKYVENAGVNNPKGFVFGCAHNYKVEEQMQSWCKENSWIYYPSQCVGTIHSGAITYASHKFTNVRLVSCAENNCTFREGPKWINERLNDKRGPMLPKSLDKSKIKIWSGSEAETKELMSWIKNDSSENKTSPLRWAVATVFTSLVLFFIAWASQVPTGTPIETSKVRLGWRLAGQKTEVCRERTAEELAKLPMHMRKNQACDVTYIDYNLKLIVDDKIALEKKIVPPGLKHDRPLAISEEVNIEPGSHKIRVEFTPANVPEARSYTFESTFDFVKGRIVLVTMKPATQELYALTEAPQF